MSDNEKTRALRAECDRRGIAYSKGYLLKGRRINEDTVTTLWDGTDDDRGLSFEEDENGELYCADAMTIEECIGAYVAGRRSDEG
jgi:hypothetical protein